METEHKGVAAVPGLTVDAGAVEESCHQILSRAEAAEHQTDPVQRGQHEHGEGQQEAAMVRLSDTAVDPTAPRNRRRKQWSSQSRYFGPIHLMMCVIVDLKVL